MDSKTNNLISIQDAAELSGKSLQTIRRAVKQKKIIAKRKKTAQGFQYLVDRASVVAFYKIKTESTDRKPGRIKKTTQDLSNDKYVYTKDFEELKNAFDHFLKQKDHENKQLYELLKALQEKFVVVENQMKLLHEPQEASKKRWYQFWRS